MSVAGTAVVPRPPTEQAKRKIAHAVRNQRQFARALGLHPSHVSFIFAGKRRPSLEVAAAMAHRINISLDDLYSFLVHAAVN